MHEFIYFNARICRAGDAFLQAISSAAFYGKGMFTTAAVFDAGPFLWEKHWRRLKSQAGKLAIDLSSFSEESVKNALFEVIIKNNLETGRARLTFFDERAVGIWKFNSLRQTSLLITTADLREISGNYRLTVSPFPVNSKSPLAGIKSINYLENLLALEEAQKRGFDEAVRLNERGEIASACLANIFWRKNGKYFTPALETGCLAGTTREYLIEEFNCFEAREDPATLNDADAVFLTSAGIGVIQITEFTGRSFEKEFNPELALPGRNEKWPRKSTKTR